MKKNLRYLLFCSFGLLAIQFVSQAQSKKIIHYWHFNTTTTGVHLGAIPADYSTLGQANLYYKPIHGGGADTIQSYIDNLAGDTINQRPGYGGCCGATNYAVRTRNPSDNMQFLWYIPTRKYQNIVIKYETQSSSIASGQHRQLFTYSVDSAKTFTSALLPVTYDSAGLAWGKVRIDLSSIAAANNTGKLVFRLAFTAPNTGTSGNNRFDNITVEGDTLIAPSFTSTALTSGIINRLYSYTITTTGTPSPVLSVSGNPAWLTLQDNILSGIPTSVDSIGPITLSASNSAGSSKQEFYIAIADSINPVAPAITSTAPTEGTTDSLYTYIITTTGVPKPTISVSGNPQWLVLHDSILSGTPPANGIFGPITVTATNILDQDQQEFSITVKAAPLIISQADTTGTANSLYSYSIIASGTPTPDLSVSGNPSWLSLDGNILSGTPPSAGIFGPITITASNTEGIIHQIYNIVVSSVPVITSAAITTGTTGSAYSYMVTAKGTPAPVFTVSGNPAWLTMVGNTLVGTPTSSGLTGPITVTATNSVSADKQTFYLNVAIPSVNSSASKLIHYWNFNNTLPEDGSGGISLGATPLYSDYSAASHAFLVYKPVQAAAKDTGYMDNLQGDTINQRQGFGGCCGDINNAIRTRNPSDSMEFLWYIPTTDYQNIVITYETQLSSVKSGQHEQIFSYSPDSAVTFTNTDLPLISNFADTVWQKVTLDLRGIDAANNNGKLVLKINFSAPNTGSKGNNRFDNITVEGDLIPEVTGIQTISGSDYSLYPNPASDYVKLVTESEGDRIISIYDATGILVSSMNASTKEMIINTSSLSSGFYYLKIEEKNGGKSNILKFVKE